MSDSEDYDEGYKAGYQKGFDAGTGAGYSDAKYRMYRALEALQAPGDPHLNATLRRVEDAVASNVGKRA
jgi:flagellar biosynthesis/type III secretory pathway protein FliH